MWDHYDYKMLTYIGGNYTEYIWLILRTLTLSALPVAKNPKFVIHHLSMIIIYPPQQLKREKEKKN